MKCKKVIRLNLDKTNETIGFFGNARLIRRCDGGHELIGGSEDERATAREWCSLFEHEIVFSERPQAKLAFAA
jgi:hypothetical protein